MAHSQAVKFLIISTSLLSLTACGLMSLPGGYTPVEQQTLNELNGANYTPRSADQREAILTQDLFAQAAFWSREYDLNPADLEAAINLANTLRRLGNPRKAIEIAQHTRALYPRDVDLMTEMAAALIADSQPREALKIIDTALVTRPNQARLWSLKGASLDQLEQFTKARQSYTKALALEPNNAGVLANVGLSYALEGDPRTAELWLRRAASMPEANSGVRQNLALVLGLQGKYEEAEYWANQDLNAENATNNIAYLRSLRGRSAPLAAVSQPQSPATPPQQTTRRPRANFGTNLTLAGDPTQFGTGPRTAREAAMAAAKQNKTRQTQNPPQALYGAPPPNPQNVLQRISQNNTPKTAIARNQRQHLAARVQGYGQQQRQPVPVGPQPPLNPRISYTPPAPYAQAAAPYPTQNSRTPSRERRR